MKLKNNGETKIYPTTGNQTTAHIDWDFFMVYLNAELEHATMFINGISTEKNLLEASPIFPVTLDGANELHLVFEAANGEIFESNNEILDSTSIDFFFQHIEDEKTTAANKE